MSPAAGLAALVVAASGVLGWSLVEGVKRYALRNAILDLPSERSSHRIPTPRGGGVGFVVLVVGGLGLAPLVGVENAFAWPVAIAVSLVAVVGWVDDHGGLGIAPRLAIQLISGGILAWSASELGLGPAVGLFAGPLVVAWWVFFTVAAVNVVNFMDGIDGLIGLQGLVYFGFVGLALGTTSAVAWIAWLAMGAVAGFLIHNWPPASIFMGDAGSGALGVIFVGLGMATIEARGWSAVHASLPLAPIFIDAAFTMGRRLRNGERIWRPHRTHVYQRLVQAGWWPARVSGLYGALSIGLAVVALLLPDVGPRFALTAVTAMLAIGVLLVVLGHRARLAIATPRPDASADRRPSPH